MAKKARFDDSGDSDELQALFDSIAAAPAKPRLEVISDADGVGDSEDLQALFDTVASDYAAQHEPPPARPAARVAAVPAAREPRTATMSEDLFQRIGQLTRDFHEALSALGYDRVLEQTARAIPDARQRLSYVAQMTEQAASRVLNATDVAKPIQEEIQRDAEELSQRWEKLYANQLSVDEFKALSSDTRNYLKTVPAKTKATNAQLLEIMMAQDFQDLTGQVIKRLVDTAQGLEQQLLSLLVEFTPDEKRPEASGLANGPVIAAAGRTDVVTSQKQVDDLLDSLGF